MEIIAGQNVDLLFPFPHQEVRRVFGWNHCFRTFSENDDVPQSVEEFTQYAESLLQVCPSWGVVDKHQLTNQKHEAPLVGVILIEPSGPRQAFLHFASARKAFKMNLIDEAAELVVQTAFDNAPALLRLGAYVDESNGPAKGLLKRLGFRFEGVCHDGVVRDGMMRNLVYYGLPRRVWNERTAPEVAPSETPACEPLSVDAVV
jgi:RimJ/RimL family protein N-acetyltransferase